MDNDPFFMDWSCTSALSQLYFEKKTDNKFIYDQIAFFWEHDQQCSGVPDGLSKDIGWKRIKEIQIIYPKLNLSMERNALLWFRFGFLSQIRGVSISDRFLKRYARWRQKSSNRFGGTNVQWKTGKLLENSKPEVLKYPLDYFLHSPKLEVSIFDDIQIDIFHDYDEKVSLPVKYKKEYTSDHVGWHALQLIGEKIKEAAAGGKIKGLTRKKEDGRYLCHLTRQELAEILQLKLKQFSVSTIVRALGDFVACSRP